LGGRARTTHDERATSPAGVAARVAGAAASFERSVLGLHGPDGDGWEVIRAVLLALEDPALEAGQSCELGGVRAVAAARALELLEALDVVEAHGLLASATGAWDLLVKAFSVHPAPPAAPYGTLAQIGDRFVCARAGPLMLPPSARPSAVRLHVPATRR